MLVAFDITDADIANAERILLPTGQVFDAERRAFIRSFETLDLHAVPGSGKTTALLAKLLVLERHLPFKDGSGILVISHTNAAVDEIARKLCDHCNKLFSYPNYVGTIQGFVDQFLAVPYYSSITQRRPTRIDNEIYAERATKFSNDFISGYTVQEQNNAKYYLRSNENVTRYRFALNSDHTISLLSSINGNPLTIRRPRSKTDWAISEKNRVAAWLIDYKRRIMNDGYLCFDDAYYLANCLRSKIPGIKDILQKRFPYVFVDEMQDMGKHQYDLLEYLFYDGGISSSTYQRIGDRNQGIHDQNDFSVDSTWQERTITLSLTNSCRLSALNARVIQPFAIQNIGCNIYGLRETDILPHILIYSDTSRIHVIENFASILKDLIDQGKVPYIMPNGDKAVFKAVAWNAEWSEDADDHTGKIRLIDYYPAFRKSEHRPPIDHDCIDNYLTSPSSTTKPFRDAYNGIFNLILKILRIEDVRNPLKNSYFNATSLRGYLHDNNYVYLDTLLLQIYRWVLASVMNESNGIVDEVRATIPSLLRIFGKSVNDSQGFINTANVTTPWQNIPTQALSNTYAYQNYYIELATIHSIKGQTHTATLYLESYYCKDGNGESAKSYESQRLASQFLGNRLTGSEGKRIKQSAKMIYVGLSRPTHLLCFAVHKDRFEKYLQGIDTSLWKIIRIDDHYS